MAKPVAKRSTKSSSTTTTPASKAKDTPPDPFTPAPSHLLGFLNTLSKKSVYITHIDTLPRFHKRNIFVIPVLLNLTIFFLLVWRAWRVVPSYLDIFFSTFGYKTASVVEVKSKSWTQLAGVTLDRTAMFVIDYALVRLVAPWPYTFFLEGPENPCTWRWKLGFREREIIVRVSRNWGRDELMESTKQGAENPFFKVRVLPAIEKEWVRTKTGYLMQDKNWDLDFDAIIRATELVDKGRVKEEDLRKSVWVWGGDTLGWLGWQVWKLDEGEAPEAEEARKKIMKFRDTLVALGKESLFFRWIELIQFESSQPGGFTPERQQDSVRKARELFEGEGIDFEELMTAVGGIRALPGLENAAANVKP